MRYGVRRCGVRTGSIRKVNATDMHPVLVVDFGAQYAQLIARRVREANVYSEIVPHTMSVVDMLAKEPAAIILSGGPSSVYEEGAPSVDPAIFEAGVPVLGICYGFQTMATRSAAPWVVRAPASTGTPRLRFPRDPACSTAPPTTRSCG